MRKEKIKTMQEFNKNDHFIIKKAIYKFIKLYTQFR